MAVKVLILEDNPVARSFLCRVVRESFSDAQQITEAGDLESARKQIALAGGPSRLLIKGKIHGPFKKPLARRKKSSRPTRISPARVLKKPSWLFQLVRCWK